MRRRGHNKEPSDADSDDQNSEINTCDSPLLENRDELLIEVYETAKSLFSENLKNVENMMSPELPKEHTIGHHHHKGNTHKNREARVYKRWIFVSSIVTLTLAWIIFPLIFD